MSYPARAEGLGKYANERKFHKQAGMNVWGQNSNRMQKWTRLGGEVLSTGNWDRN